MKFLRRAIIAVLLIAIVICMLPAAAFFAIHTIERGYSLRVNSFSTVDQVLDDYETLADVITNRLGEEKISAGDELYFSDGRLYVRRGKTNQSVPVSRSESLALKHLETFSYAHNMVRVSEQFYRISAENSSDMLVYSKDGKRPPKTDPDDDTLVFYAPKKLNDHFYVLVKNPNPNANYFKEGFDIVKWGLDKVKNVLGKDR